MKGVTAIIIGKQKEGRALGTLPSLFDYKVAIFVRDYLVKETDVRGRIRKFK